MLSLRYVDYVLVRTFKNALWNLINKEDETKNIFLINYVGIICKYFFDNLNLNINKQFHENIEDYNPKRRQKITDMIEEIIDWISYTTIL